MKVKTSFLTCIHVDRMIHEVLSYINFNRSFILYLRLFILNKHPRFNAVCIVSCCKVSSVYVCVCVWEVTRFLYSGQTVFPLLTVSVGGIVYCVHYWCHLQRVQLVKVPVRH